jgi:hypothetical protein
MLMASGRNRRKDIIDKCLEGQNFMNLQTDTFMIFPVSAMKNLDAMAPRSKVAARQSATQEELPQENAENTKNKRYKLLSSCSLRSFTAKILSKKAKLFRMAVQGQETKLARTGFGEIDFASLRRCVEIGGSHKCM